MVYVMSLPAFTGSGASAFEMLSAGAEETVVVTTAPAVGDVSLDVIWYEPFVITVPFASGAFTFTTICTDPDTPVFRAPMFQVTTLPASAPPPVADTNVVFVGRASVIATPVAFSLPEFE